MNGILDAGAACEPGVAADGLFDALYSELHRLARREVNRPGPSPRLGVTTVLHETYLKISRGAGVFADRARFLGYAAKVMRGVIIDEIRRHRSQKRGGLMHITSLATHHLEQAPDPGTLARISDALDELARLEPELADVVNLKFFCGFSFAEIATMRGVSERTIQRSWEKGRIYLHQAIGDADGVAAGRDAAAVA